MQCERMRAMPEQLRFLQSAEFRVQRSDNTCGGLPCVFFIFERGGEL